MRLIKYIARFFDKIEKFCYYGMAGIKCEDYDANSVDTLIYAHMKRVQKFMKGPNTHLIWNSKENHNKGLMRKLDEFVELCKRRERNGLRQFDNYSKFMKENFPEEKGLLLDIKDEKLKRKLRIALKKDRAIEKSWHKRYYKMYEKYLPGFWD